MSLTTALIGLGLPVEQAALLGSQGITTTPILPIEINITSSGTVISDAYQLKALFNYIVYVDTATGVRLPNSTIGQPIYITNASAKNLHIFPLDSSCSINGQALGQEITIGSATTTIIFRVSDVSFLQVL